ncbi:MAG: hypothetical protein KF795_10525 [Labilithrix sp.]|nr:hypothetical protein [Labilithrix sp.]
MFVPNPLTAAANTPIHPKAYFVGGDLLYVPLGEAAWRRRHLDTWELDPAFLETEVLAPVASEQRLTWMSRRTPDATTWEFRYLDFPAGAPSWSNVAVPQEALMLIDGSYAVSPTDLEPADGGVSTPNSRFFRSPGALGTFIYYLAYDERNPSRIVNRLDTSQPGSLPTSAFAVTWPTGMVEREAAFVGTDLLYYAEPIDDVVPQDESTAEREARVNEPPVCGLVFAYSLVDGVRRIVGGRTGSVSGMLAAGDLFVQGGHEELYDTKPSTKAITVRKRAPQLPTPSP